MKGTTVPTPGDLSGVRIDVTHPAWPVPPRRPGPVDDLWASGPRVRAAAALGLAEQLLTAPGSLPRPDRGRLVRQLPEQLAASSGRERAALLALVAALADDLTPAARAAVHAHAGPDDDTPLPLAVATQVCALTVEGFGMPDTLIADLATLVGTPESVAVIAHRGPNSERALRLLIATARALV